MNLFKLSSAVQQFSNSASNAIWRYSVSRYVELTIAKNYRKLSQYECDELQDLHNDLYQQFESMRSE